MVRGKSTDEIRKTFNIVFDSPGEGQAASVSTIADSNPSESSPQSDPMNQ